MSQDVFINHLNFPYLIVGLGNPGREYIKSRHNAGFMLVQQFAEHVGIHFSRMESKALIAKTKLENKQVLLAKPQTYMNESGKAVSALLRFYKVPIHQLLVVYDDIDLPLGTLRLRACGGSGGHKGMRSIIEMLNSSSFPRLRLGVGRPSGHKQAANYVLQDFSPHEEESVCTMLERGLSAIEVFILSGIETAMNEYNST